MIIKNKMANGGEKLTVNCYAVVMPDEMKIQVFLDETISDWKKQLARYESEGFTVVHLIGEAKVNKKELTFTKKEVIEKLDPYFMRESIDVILRKLGF